MTAAPGQYDLKIGLPKQSRLRDPFNAVMAQAGLSYEAAGSRRDDGVILDDNQPEAAVKAYELRPEDALDRLQEGVVDMCVVGFDMLAEYNAAAGGDGFEYTALPVSPCAMWIASDRPLNDWSDLNGLRIATKYEATARALLAENNVDARVVRSKGGSEGTIAMGIADAVMDMVDTGGTLKAYGLSKQFKVYSGSAVLVRRAGEAETPVMQAMREKLTLAATEVARPAETVVPFAPRRAFA